MGMSKLTAFEDAKRELLEELAIANAIDSTAEVAIKVADYKAELEKSAADEKQAKIDDLQLSIKVVDRLIAQEEAAVAAAEEAAAEEAVADEAIAAEDLA